MTYLMWTLMSVSIANLPSINTENLQLRLMMEAKSLKALQNSQNLIGKIKLSEKTCYLELENKKVPKNCYSWLHYLSLAKATEDLKLTETREWLDLICVRYAKKVRRIQHLEIPLHHLSKTCSAAVHEQKNKLVYIYRETINDLNNRHDEI